MAMVRGDSMQTTRKTRVAVVGAWFGLGTLAMTLATSCAGGGASGGSVTYNDDAGATCGPGTFVNGPACTPCPSGTFFAGQNARACTPWRDCTAGEFVSVEGTAVRDQTCSPCASGTFSTIANASTCSACAAGTVSSTGATTCISGELVATSASMTGPGLNDCGPDANDVCARSPIVLGGPLLRGTDASNPATISAFRLDKYEVTVGRFRSFVKAWVGGWRPAAGSGKHGHLNLGRGLVKPTATYETGWDAVWTNYVGALPDGLTPSGPGATTNADWNANLNCRDGFSTWTGVAGGNETRPQNCLSWYDLYAFCIWDGGFLPSEAEWEHAAAGGIADRAFPWGNEPPAESLASYYVDDSVQCRGDGRNGCTLADLLRVGTKPTGNGLWGQSDLAGNVLEWTFDSSAPYRVPCADCANDDQTYLTRAARGGSVAHSATGLAAAARASQLPVARDWSTGGRCARSP